MESSIADLMSTGKRRGKANTDHGSSGCPSLLGNFRRIIWLCCASSEPSWLSAPQQGWATGCHRRRLGPSPWRRNPAAATLGHCQTSCSSSGLSLGQGLRLCSLKLDWRVSMRGAVQHCSSRLVQLAKLQSNATHDWEAAFRQSSSREKHVHQTVKPWPVSFCQIHLRKGLLIKQSLARLTALSHLSCGWSEWRLRQACRLFMQPRRIRSSPHRLWPPTREHTTPVCRQSSLWGPRCFSAHTALRKSPMHSAHPSCSCCTC